MCHERLRRREERTEDARDERLWDLFHRETEQNAPPVSIANREEREEVLTRAARRAEDSH